MDAGKRMNRMKKDKDANKEESEEGDDKEKGSELEKKLTLRMDSFWKKAK